MQSKNLLYILTCLAFSVICGAALYEHSIVWPAAFSKLPASMVAFNGEYKMNNGIFWQAIHPITLVLFIITLITTWKTGRRKYILVPMVIYVLILAITFIYFVPELLSILGTPYSNTYDATLTGRGATWVNLSLVRMVVLFLAGVFMLMGLTKPEKSNRV